MAFRDKLPDTLEKLKKMPFKERADLWNNYSKIPFRRQMKALWYYIQCDKLHVHIEEKYLKQIREYIEKPNQCLIKINHNKYNLIPGSVLTKNFKGKTYSVYVNDDNTFSYNNKKYTNLTSIAQLITGMKISGPHFLRVKKKEYNANC